MPNDNQAQLGQTEMSALLDELNKVYTPILAANALNDGIVGPSNGTVLKFDDETRKAQLVSVCARLISKFKSNPDYDEFVNAANRAKALKLKMQKETHGASVALADAYLHQLMASGTNADIVRSATALSAVKVTLG